MVRATILLGARNLPSLLEAGADNFCVVGAVAVTFVAFTGMERLQFITIPNPLVRLPDTAMAAVAGAYLWIVFDLISRARRLDFAPSDLDTAIVRFVVAVPLGYAFGALATPSIRPFIAFAMGAFPVAMIGSMARRLANKALNQEQTQEERRNDLVKLQGVNRAILERLEKEDITTVTQIAYCDPVRLTMRSNLSFNFVTDCMNQALAWMYLEKDLDVIRPLGLRGAAEIKDLVDAYDDYDSQDSYGRAEHKRAVGAMPSIANALNQDPNTVQIVFRQIAEDPFTDFLCKVWCDPLRSPRPSGSELGFDVLVYRPA